MNLEIKTIITTISVWISSFWGYIWITWNLEKTFWLFTFLLVIDWITWTWKWIVNKELSSKKSWIWILSKLTLLFVPLVIAILLTIVWMNPEFLLWFIFIALALTEAYSILSNIYNIITWKTIKEFDGVAIILWTLLWWVQKQFYRQMQHIENTNLDMKWSNTKNIKNTVPVEIEKKSLIWEEILEDRW